MNFKQLYTSSKTYIILLVVALAVLIFSTSTTYKQIKRMQESAETVNHTLQVYNGISKLTTHYTEAESEEFRNNILKTDGASIIFKNYQEEGRSIIDSLRTLTSNNPSQLNRVEALNVLLNRLYQQLQEADSNQFHAKGYSQEQKMKINGTLHHIRDLTVEMIDEVENLMEERKAVYNSYKSLAPITLLLLGVFALFVFVISFIRIYKNKIRFRESEAFLKSVVGTTDNVVNYYEPIFDASENIVDFQIVFANDRNRDYFRLEPDEIIGKTVIEVYPFLKDSDTFNSFKVSYKNKEKVKFEVEMTMNQSQMWFQCVSTPLLEGILITARNSTVEEEARKEQLTLKKELEDQNLRLLDNHAFLGNIFKSISHVIMNFKSIRDDQGEIIDFEILFVNDRINPLIGDQPENLKNKKLSQVFPEVFENGVFERLVSSVEQNKSETYELSHLINDKLLWFRSTAIKLGDGVTVTMREITDEKQKENQLINLNEQLIIRNSILTDAESMAKIGSFLWYTDSDTLEISDNFFHMLGYKPKGFESSIKRYKEFIHPEDLSLVENMFRQSVDDLQPKEYTYRVITKSDSIKYFKTNEQFINKEDKTVMIGVVQDVTDALKAEASLRKSNLELKQSNAELESFNRVASHDLQEPLRKIQLFISRIEDKEDSQFSEKSKEYFEKVKNAGSRMQSLIQNLLTYSRIDSSEANFSTIHLNQVLEKVSDDLTTHISEAKAEIKIGELPEIKGLFFQMEQLFSNLISNSLKYRSLTEKPMIEIQSEKIPASGLPLNNIKTHTYYYKITVTDNGIGFDNQHAQKIFEVFQRLHQRTEYTGTGIGLAICKKIVENHNGFIYATSKLGEGAQFVVLLPV